MGIIPHFLNTQPPIPTRLLVGSLPESDPPGDDGRTGLGDGVLGGAADDDELVRRRSSLRLSASAAKAAATLCSKSLGSLSLVGLKMDDALSAMMVVSDKTGAGGEGAAAPAAMSLFGIRMQPCDEGESYL